MTPFGDLNLKIPIDVGYSYFLETSNIGFLETNSNLMQLFFSGFCFSKSEVKFTKQTSICQKSWIYDSKKLYICVFQVTCNFKIGKVGRKIFLF